ncbi:alpha/beta hydrolase [Geodermatophilus sp. SYSU D00696]
MTPLPGAEYMAEDLTAGVLVVWQGQGHTAYPKTECTRKCTGSHRDVPCSSAEVHAGREGAWRTWRDWPAGSPRYRWGPWRVGAPASPCTPAGRCSAPSSSATARCPTGACPG